MLANLAQYLPAVRSRQIQIQQNEVGEGLASRLAYAGDVSHGFLAIANYMQSMPDVMFLQGLLHEQNVPGIIFEQKYHTAAATGKRRAGEVPQWCLSHFRGPLRHRNDKGADL